MSEQIEFDLQPLFAGLSITLEEEMGLFAHRIDVEIRRMRRMGVSDKAIYEMLLLDAKEGGRLFGQFNNSIKGHLYNGIQDASVIGEYDIYQEEGIDTDMREWIVQGSDTGPCPNCAVRTGMVLPYADWIEIGLPGTGWSVCKGACLCRLIPAGLSE